MRRRFTPVGKRPGTGRMADPRAQALSATYESNVDSVFSFLVARSGSREIAAEVTSETFVEAARLFRQDRGHTVSQAWLIHVARLRLIDHWRRSERHERRLQRLRQHRLADFGADEEQPVDSDALDALRSLSERHRLVLVLRYLDDYTVGEVAQAMDLTYQATESLLARARRSLADRLTQSEAS